MVVEQGRTILREFNRRVDTARNHRAVTRLSGAGSITYELLAVEADDRWSMFTVNDGPDREAWDAFVLHLRFLVQDNEPTSIRNLRLVYNTVSIRSDLRGQFHIIRDKLNCSLDAGSGIAFTDDGVRMGVPDDSDSVTYRHVFDTYVNGELAHRHMGHFEGGSWEGDAKKKDRFDDWATNPLQRMHADMLFNSALRKIIDGVFCVYDLNVIALRELGKSASAKR